MYRNLVRNVFNDHDITGINVNDKEFKSTMIVDDATFAMDGSLKSFQKLEVLLNDFKSISGLKLNVNKQLF